VPRMIVLIGFIVLFLDVTNLNCIIGAHTSRNISHMHQPVTACNRTQ
jgi:hypothetical protein